MVRHGGQTWWSDIAVRRGGQTWWSDMVVRHDGQTWRSDMAVRHGGQTWWSDMAANCDVWRHSIFEVVNKFQQDIKMHKKT